MFKEQAKWGDAEVKDELVDMYNSDKIDSQLYDELNAATPDERQRKL